METTFNPPFWFFNGSFWDEIMWFLRGQLLIIFLIKSSCGISLFMSSFLWEHLRGWAEAEHSFVSVMMSRCRVTWIVSSAIRAVRVSPRWLLVRLLGLQCCDVPASLCLVVRSASQELVSETWRLERPRGTWSISSLGTKRVHLYGFISVVSAQ